MPVLCVMTQADKSPRINMVSNEFEGPGVLMLEDLDMWYPPLNPGHPDSCAPTCTMLPRGVREAMDLIRSAVESPEVYVLACAGTEMEIDPFFYELLNPITLVDIDEPTVEERRELWQRLAIKYPSLRPIDSSELVRFSVHMSRFDICVAAREAVEDAYKESLAARRYVPVTIEGIYERLAAFHPLDSLEYHQMEDAVVRSFMREIESFEGFADTNATGFARRVDTKHGHAGADANSQSGSEA